MVRRTRSSHTIYRVKGLRVRSILELAVICFRLRNYDKMNQRIIKRKFSINNLISFSHYGASYFRILKINYRKNQRLLSCCPRLSRRQSFPGSVDN